MKKFAFSSVYFVTSAKDQKGYPKTLDSEGQPLPEIAVAGRSNVGKSSLLNHLFGVKNLVKTSQKPGKTRLLNFFQIDDLCVFCDLPGYGFANVKQPMRDSWGKMIETYIEKRESLKVILLLLDVRRTKPSDKDLQFYEWVSYHEKPIIIVFTKGDKVSKNVAAANMKKNLEHFGETKLTKVLYSVPNNTGKKELMYELKAKLYASDE